MNTEAEPKRESPGYMALLTLGALGVVFGDIGTSPLYAIRECFHGEHGIALTHDNILGVLSLITWSLIIVITIKYLVFVMRADNKGEGGVLALMALAQKSLRRNPRASYFVTFIGLFGAALLYGDGMITPAISVLGAVEGLGVAAPIFTEFTELISVFILILLFLPQHRGTGGVGTVFGPVILIWFFTIALLGIVNISYHPTILAAVNPWYCVLFFIENHRHGLGALGAVFLVVTGGEALYADMGHFGKKPIRIGWFLFVLPALLLNYFGQGALLLDNPETIDNPFFRMAPKWAIYPLVGIATMAAVIASQALISGAFSLTSQAVHMGFLPRTHIKHTSYNEIGQIYSPLVNWILMVSTIFLVLFFRSSSNLAAAYGIAVTLTMAITSVLMFFVTRYLWHWKLFPCVLVTLVLLAIDSAFVGANFVKIVDGGWFPLLVAVTILIIMTTWRAGRKILAERMRERSVPIERYLKDIEKKNFTRVAGTAIYMTSNIDYAPFALVNNSNHNKVIHEHVLLIIVQTEDVPVIDELARTEITRLPKGFFQVVVRFGFMEVPDISKVINKVFLFDKGVDTNDVTYFIGRETLIATERPGMAIWREHLFALMARNAQRATSYFNIPSEEVIEIGMQIEL